MMISNRYDPEAKMPELIATRAMIKEAETGWSYSHHPSITFFKGRYHAIWSNGRKHEDYPGQRVMTANSYDGIKWTNIRPLVESWMGKETEVVLTAAGFHQFNGMLIAYFGVFEYSKGSFDLKTDTRIKISHMDTELFALTTTDGVNWSAPVSMGIPIVPNHGPQKTASGRLIISGNFMFPYTDDPSGLSGWKLSGIYPDDWSDVYDDSEAHSILQKKMGWDANLCEGSFYQTDDGAIHMLLRSNVHKLWYTQSRDDGVTWSQPTETEFSDNCSKFHFGKLADGRFYYVGTPDPFGIRRCPLVLSLSYDGVLFDNHYIIASKVYEQKNEGRSKGGVYGYPHTLIHDGRMYVICSICKEDMAVYIFDLNL